jgi:hypothetical protein
MYSPAFEHARSSMTLSGLNIYSNRGFSMMNRFMDDYKYMNEIGGTPLHSLIKLDTNNISRKV